jgi:hypothetical protein
MQLIGAGHKLPGLAEYVELFQLGDPGIDVPGCWDSRSLREWGTVVVNGENLLNGRWHISVLEGWHEFGSLSYRIAKTIASEIYRR